MSKLIYVNSKFRTNQTEKSSDFTVHLNIQNFVHLLGQDHADTIQLVSCIIPNKVPNVQSYNNVLVSTINGVPTTITVPPKQYQTPTLITSLSGLTGVTITSDADGFLTFTTDGVTILTITKATSSISEIIGLTEDVNIGVSSSYKCLRSINLDGVDAWVISSRVLAPNNSLDNNYVASNDNVMAVLPNNVAYRSNFVYIDTSIGSASRVVHPNGLANVQSFDIRITDTLMRPLDIPDDVILNFRLYH